MFRLNTLILIIIAAAAGLTMYKIGDVGFLNAGIAEHRIETTLLIAGGVFIAGVFALLVLFRIFSLLHKVTVFFGAQRKARLLEKARSALSHGLIELAEGRFEEAEKLLLKQIKHSDNALLAYLSAARAAQQQGEHERRDEYLRKAHEATPTAEIAIGLTRAELQLAHEQYEQALANLRHLYELSPKHAYVIKLLLKTYHHLADWKKLQVLLEDTKRLKLLPRDRIHHLELDIWRGLLDEQVQASNLPALNAVWHQVPESLKAETGLVEHYAQLLLDFDMDDRAEQVLRHYLNSNWSESAVVLYSQLDVAIDLQQLDQVESWLKEHQHNAHLLLAMGKLCLNKKLWGKARHYLEASLAIHAMPQTYLKLAQLLEQHMDDAKQAQLYYRRGLECLAEEAHHETVITSSLHSKTKPPLMLAQSD